MAGPARRAGGAASRSRPRRSSAPSPLVKPGGRIAYVTCSVLDEENGAQIRDFIGRHPDFSVEKPAEVANALGERAYLFSQAALVSDEGLLMTPRRTDTDGFFVSLLRRSCMTSAAAKLDRTQAAGLRTRYGNTTTRFSSSISAPR